MLLISCRQSSRPLSVPFLIHRKFHSREGSALVPLNPGGWIQTTFAATGIPCIKYILWNQNLLIAALAESIKGFEVDLQKTNNDFPGYGALDQEAQNLGQSSGARFLLDFQ